jgi:ankyrin repeat protein
MVRFFLNHVPRTAAIRTDKQKLAIHFAAGDGHTEIVRHLLEVFPQGASLPSAKGKLAIHFAARWDHLKIAQDLYFVFPDGVRQVDWEGNLPLHDAAREGQVRMARYLMDLYPAGLCSANIRDEIPLFPAVRAGNVDLIVLMIQAWPGACRHVLRQLSADDRVEDWDILDVLLRGAVLNFHDCSLFTGREPPPFTLPYDMEVVSSVGSEKTKKRRKVTLGYDANTVNANLSEAEPVQIATSIEVTKEQTRCKSPILEEIEVGRKKRTAPFEVGTKTANKASHSFDLGDLKLTASGSVFLPLHAALAAGSSFHVLQWVFEKYHDTRNAVDNVGRTALHCAVQVGHDDKAIRFIIDNIVNPESASTRDLCHRLPLHMAIASKADSRIVEALLEAYPPGGVEPCRREMSGTTRFPSKWLRNADAI